nr:gluconokinase [Actinomycetales bacterium]
MSTSITIDLSQAEAPFVLAFDVGSTGTRAGIYDALARPVRGHRAKVGHAFTTVANGTSTIDPDQVVAEAREVMGAVLDGFPHQIAGVCICTFASSLVGEADGRALTPCYTYADSRPAPQVNYLKSILNEDEVQQRTGTRQHTGYLPARFLWLRQTDEETFGRVERWMSLGEYVWLRLIGVTAAGVSTAAWTGMLNRREATWDAELCGLAGVDPHYLTPIAPPSQPLEPVIAPGYPQLAEAAWFPPISDGHGQSIGAGSSDPGTLILSAATSGAMRAVVEGDIELLPRGVWCNRIDENRSILGGAINDVGRAFSWLGETLLLPPQDEIDAFLERDPVPGLPIVLPWFSGERSTGWVGEARAVFHRVSAATTPLELYRATAEGVAFSYARMLRELALVVGAPREILATGRVTGDVPALLQMVADVTATPVTPITLKRSTLRGTALHALEVLVPDVEPAPAPRGATIEPDTSRYPYYHRRMERFGVIYDKVIAHAN